MKKIISFLVITLTVASGFSEEVSDISQAELDEQVYSDAMTVPRYVQVATSAGVGVFTGACSLTNVTFVDIHVQEWWTPDPGTNTVRLHKIDRLNDEWMFPTNIPVVFFAVTKAQWHGEDAAYYLTNAAERAELTFANVNRSWFRTTRDNGLVYAFATNLWNCVRINPNPTNYYEVLRDVQRTIAKQDSWRVQLDSRNGLSWLFDEASENYLTDKLNDPLLSPIMKNSVGNWLSRRFGWIYSYTNNIEVWTPPQ